MADTKGPKTVVLGAGPTGLAVAMRLSEGGDRTELLEIEGELGGASRTFRWNDFLVDTGPHKIYSNLEGIMDAVRDLLGDELMEVPKASSIHLRGRSFDYPFRFPQLLTRLSPFFGFQVGFSYLGALLRERGRPDRSYEDWVVKRFGSAMYETVFKGLAEKIWGDPRGISADMARRRIVTPGLAAVAKKILCGGAGKQSPAKVFYYPRMGIGRLNERMRERIESSGGKVLTRHTVRRLAHRDGRVTSAEVVSGGVVREVPVDRFVSTIALEDLLGLLDPAPPQEVLRRARALKMRPVMLAFIAFKTPRLTPDAWSFFPERRYLFNRISEQKGFSEAMCPPDRTVLCLDITAGHRPEAWDWPADKVLRECLDGLRDCGLHRGEQVLASELVKLRGVYPVYDLHYQENLAACLECVHSFSNLYTTGRNGLFCYNNVDQCLDMGFRLAAHILGGGGREGLRRLLEYFDAYEIVD